MTLTNTTLKDFLVNNRLLPKLTFEKESYSNTSNFYFSWLFIEVWSLDTFQIEISFVFDPTQHGIGFTFMFPYLRVVTCIPFTTKFAKKFFLWTARNL
jgi:hypothetical protein